MRVNKLAVLCIDDDEDALTIIQLALELDPAIHVQCVRTGAEAIRFMEDGLNPDVLLIDANMPRLSGPELAIAVQMISASTPPLILFLTAAVVPRQIDEYLAAGASGVIAKPVNPLALAGIVRAHFVARTA